MWGLLLSCSVCGARRASASAPGQAAGVVRLPCPMQPLLVTAPGRRRLCGCLKGRWWSARPSRCCVQGPCASLECDRGLQRGLAAVASQLSHRVAPDGVWGLPALCPKLGLWLVCGTLSVVRPAGCKASEGAWGPGRRAGGCAGDRDTEQWGETRSWGSEDPGSLELAVWLHGSGSVVGLRVPEACGDCELQALLHGADSADTASTSVLAVCRGRVRCPGTQS